MKETQTYNQRLGELGEELAALCLSKRGYTILKRNYRCKSGEIDIIASEKNTLHFIEVKTRTTEAYGMPAESITAKKQRNLRRAAACYLSENIADRQYKENLQFDAVEIQLNHIQNIL